MAKLKKPFQFSYPLKHKVVRDLQIVTEHVGDLQVEGIGYFDPSVNPIDVESRYAVDIETAKWNGQDIKPVLELMGNLEDVEDYALRHVAKLFDAKQTEVPHAY